MTTSSPAMVDLSAFAGLFPPSADWLGTVLLVGVGAVLAGSVAALVVRARGTGSAREAELQAQLEATREDLAETERLLTDVNRQLAQMVVERERRSRWLEEARSRAEEASRAKSRFLANMSHELRTPLNSVIGFSNQLVKNRRGRFEERDLLYLRRISENGAHLLALIDQILDLAKIEAGRTEAKMVPSDLRSVVREVAGQLEGQTLERPVELRVEIPMGVGQLMTDPPKLKQVLINLVGNALKFTERGTVTLAVRADENGRPFCLEVVDEGIGIPDDRLDSIFEVFEQGDSTTSRTYGGTGLGLALSKSLCDLMGYGLEVESQVGRGSTFRLVFPTGPRIQKNAPERHPTPVAAEDGLREA